MLDAFAGGRLLGARHGSAPARVVALPGWRRTHADFDAVLTGLDAIAVDPPGFGSTAEPPAPWGAADYAAAVAPALEEIGQPVVLVGHSFGGRVAVHLAAARPELVKALVLTGVPLLRLTAPPAPKLGYRLARWLNRRGVISDERMEARRRQAGSADYNAAAGVMRDVLVRTVNETYEPQLAAVTCPVELVWGDADSAAPLGVAERAAEIVGGATVTVVPGDHFAPIREPAALRAAVERHL